MQYDETANGREVEARVKDELEISLSETRIAGYRWVVKSAGEPACRLLQDVASPNSPGVGGSGKHVWQFRAVADGNGQIEFEYARPWEKSEPSRTFVLKVRVRS